MCAFVYVCMLCPGSCITPSPSLVFPSLSVCVCVCIDQTPAVEKCLPSTQNQWPLFSRLQRHPVICNEYKTHIVAHETHTHTPHLYDPSPLAAVAGSHTNPLEIGLNYKSVTLNWKKYGSVGACLQPSLQSPNKTWVRPTPLRLSPDCKVYYYSCYIHCAVPVNQTRQPRAWMKHHPSSIVLSSISKVANKCLFSQWAVHFISGTGIRSRLFSPLCKRPSLSFSLAVLNSFLLAVCLSVRDYRWW